MPPVTTWPVNGSRLQIFWMYGGISMSSVVTVALIHFECSGSPQNTSGWPKLGSCLAMRRHMSQPPPGRICGSHLAGSVCEPIEEFSTQPPLVMNTRSLSLKAIVRVAPSASVRSMRVAIFLVGELCGLRTNVPDSACFFRIVSCPTPVCGRAGPMPPPILNSTLSTLTL